MLQASDSATPFAPFWRLDLPHRTGKSEPSAGAVLIFRQARQSHRTPPRAVFESDCYSARRSSGMADVSCGSVAPSPQAERVEGKRPLAVPGFCGATRRAFRSSRQPQRSSRLPACLRVRSDPRQLAAGKPPSDSVTSPGVGMQRTCECRDCMSHTRELEPSHCTHAMAQRAGAWLQRCHQGFSRVVLRGAQPAGRFKSLLRHRLQAVGAVATGYLGAVHGPVGALDRRLHVVRPGA